MRKDFIRKYSYEQNDLFYLSPYCRVEIESDNLIVWQAVFDQSLQIKCEESVSRELINELSCGTTEEKIKKIMSNIMTEIETETFIRECMRAGVIE